MISNKFCDRIIATEVYYNLTEIKKIKLLQIEKARILLNIELENGVITEKDLINLLSERADYGFIKKDEFNSYKKRILKDIFNSPFLLCDQENISIRVKKLLPIFLKCRYDMEIDQLNYMYNECYINEEEFEKEKKLIKFYYYQSSTDGKSILKTGHVNNVLNNIIRTK